MHLHPYVRIALGAALIILSATVVFAPSPDQDEGSTVTAAADARSSAAKTDDRAEVAARLRGRRSPSPRRT